MSEPNNSAAAGPNEPGGPVGEAGSVRTSIAAQAVSAGRPMLARSFRMHRPRGAFCHDGWCQQCKVTLPDGRVVLACQTAGDPSSLPAAGWTWKRVLGLIAQRTPPWFYEGRFLRPKFMRQHYLNWLRGVSGAHALPQRSLSREDAGRRWRKVAVDTLVVGGGLAGLAAAGKLSGKGKRVALVERLAATEQDSSDDRMRLAREAARAGGCDIYDGALCVGLYQDPKRALCVADAGALSIEYAELVVATGAYDKWLTFPGNDLPGIVGARAFARLLRQRAVPANARIGVYADERSAAAIIDEARRANCAIAWLAGPDRLPAGAMIQVPDVRLESAYGMRKIRGVRLAGRRLPCDMLVLGFSQPTYELQAQAGARMTLAGSPPIAVPVGGDPAVLAVGEAAGDFSADIMESTRQRVDAWLNAREPEPVPSPADHEKLKLMPDEAIVCPCEDVRVRDLRNAVEDGYRDIELVKRHTGAGTGPCQGKLCHGAMLQCMADAGLDVRIPTPRPLVRPTPLRMFLGADDE
ncbi:MAG: (2Fe-2S)-binding protein [Candidimonas sp.]